MVAEPVQFEWPNAGRLYPPNAFPREPSPGSVRPDGEPVAPDEPAERTADLFVVDWQLLPTPDPSAPFPRL